MKERPIIFSTDMVKAILEDRKTQTRRLNGLERFNKEPNEWKIGKMEVAGKIWWEASRDWTYSYRVDCPYGQVGDRLWVREFFFLGGIKPNEWVWYKVDTKQSDLDKFVWRPSIFMPRWASRITLEITGVRVERLQEISDKDAESEGFCVSVVSPSPIVQAKNYCYARDVFADYWDSINAKRGYGWETNPWVWVIEFKKLPAGGV